MKNKTINLISSIKKKWLFLLIFLIISPFIYQFIRYEKSSFLFYDISYDRFCRTVFIRNTAQENPEWKKTHLKNSRVAIGALFKREASSNIEISLDNLESQMIEIESKLDDLDSKMDDLHNR